MSPNKGCKWAEEISEKLIYKNTKLYIAIKIKIILIIKIIIDYVLTVELRESTTSNSTPSSKVMLEKPNKAPKSKPKLCIVSPNTLHYVETIRTF